jgi:hypothetical protein
VYLRTDGPGVLSLYRKLMSQISFPELRSLCAEAQASYARAELAHSRDLSPAKSLEAVQKVNSEADWVAQAFAATELQATAVLDRQSQDLDREGIGRKDFTRVIPNLLNRDLDDAAYRWITGGELADEELRRLGISENIQSALKVQMGIQALLILSQRAGRPFALLLDQVEAFVTGEDGLLDLTNVGTLRAIVERVPKTSGLLVMAMRDATWAKPPLDLVQRFGPSEIYTAGLSAEEATELVAVYVHKWWEKGAERTFPFDVSAMRQALRNSGGNVRLFVQLCSLLFTVAAPTKAPIDGKLATEVLSNETSPVPDKKSLRARLTELLTAAHVPFQAGYVLGNATVDFAITTGAGGFRAFIVLTDALFGTQEMALARKTLDLVRKAQNQSHPAEVILVVCGYMSPELTSELGEVHRVIVVTSATGSQELTKLVTDLSTPISPAAGTATADLEERLAAILASLTALERERAYESAGLRERVSDLATTQAEKRQSGELDETRRQWREAEDEIGRELRAARRNRQDAELAELERLRASAERDRRRIVALGLVVVTVVLAVMGGVVGNALGYYWEPGTLLGVAAAALVATAVVTFTYGPATVRDLAGPVVSVHELDRLARAYTARPLIVRAPLFGTTRGLLRRRNPRFRYAATVARQAHEPSLHQWSCALASERSAIVRRALVRKMVSGTPDRADLGLDAILEVAKGDAATSAVFDMLGETANPVPDDLDPAKLSKLCPGSDTLTALYTFPIFSASLLNSFIIATRDPFWARGLRPERLGELAEAYLHEDDIGILQALSSLPERELRAAAARLSPFDEGQLGTFDWLAKIEEIDQMYLFFRRCLYYLGRGLSDSPLP